METGALPQGGALLFEYMERKQYRIYAWFYRRFLLFLAISMLVIAGICLTIYSIAEKELRNSEFEKSELEIEYFIRDIDEIFMEALEAGDQVTHNLIIGDVVSRRFDLRNYDSIRAIKNIIYFQNSILEAYPYIWEIQTYELNNGLCISSSGIAGLGNLQKEELEALSAERQRRWLKPEELSFAGDSENSRLAIPVYGYDQRYRCLILIEMDNEKIYDMIADRTADSTRTVSILDGEGRVLYNREGLEQIGILDQAETAAAGHQILQGTDGRYLVTAHISDINGWKYTAAVPETEIIGRILEIRQGIAVLILVFCLMILAALYGMARRLFAPVKSIKSLLNSLERPEQWNVKNEITLLDYQIRDVVRQLQRERHKNLMMQEQLEQSEKEEKTYLLYKLLFGNREYSGTEESAFLRLGIPQRPCVCAAAELELDGSAAAGNAGFPAELREKVLTGAEYILDTLMKERQMEYRRLRICAGTFTRIYLVCFLPEQEEPYSGQELKADFRFYQNLLLQYFGCLSTVAIGGEKAGPGALSESREEAEKLLGYKFAMGPGQVLLYSEEEQQSAAAAADYHRERMNLKKEVDACGPAQLEEILRRYGHRIQELGLREELEYFCKDILNTVYEALLEKETTDPEVFRILTKYFMDFKQNFETYDAFVRILSDLWASAWTEETAAAYSPAVTEAVEILRKEYQRDLSLQEVADRLQLSAPYLSRIFKEETGESFKAYLTRMKLQKAKDLLANTDMPVQDIAAWVGYHDAKHFSVIFKKQFGVTAGTYRKMTEGRKP